MALLNPQLGKDIACTPGIVLIDELDIHLHPQWQWLVAEALQHMFPHVQFIVATHSPIIIASLKHGWIIDISDQMGPTYQKARFGLDVGNTLKQVQGSKDMPQEVAIIQKEFNNALTRKGLMATQAVVQKLERLVGPDRPVSVEPRTTYELESTLAKE